MKINLSDNGYDSCSFLDFDASNDFFLYEIGTYKCPSGYSYGPALRTHDIFHFVISGKGKLYINNEIHEIGPKQGFLIPANVTAYYEADEEDPWSYFWLHLGGSRLSEIFYHAGLNADQPVFTSTDHSLFFEERFAEICDHQEEELFCIGKIYELANYLVQHSIHKVTNEGNLQLKYVKKTIKYIQLNYSEPIHIDDIAHACGLNRSYLSRLFKDATGSSVQSYLKTYRMKMATQFMRETTHSIQDISFAVGYNDIFTFSKAFKKHYGISPSEFRKQLQ